MLAAIIPHSTQPSRGCFKLGKKFRELIEWVTSPFPRSDAVGFHFHGRNLGRRQKQIGCPRAIDALQSFCSPESPELVDGLAGRFDWLKAGGVNSAATINRNRSVSAHAIGDKLSERWRVKIPGASSGVFEQTTRGRGRPRSSSSQFGATATSPWSLFFRSNRRQTAFRPAQGQRCHHRCYDQIGAGSTPLTVSRQALGYQTHSE
jgi:hypothetical protein